MTSCPALSLPSKGPGGTPRSTQASKFNEPDFAANLQIYAIDTTLTAVIKEIRKNHKNILLIGILKNQNLMFHFFCLTISKYKIIVNHSFKNFKSDNAKEQYSYIANLNFSFALRNMIPS